MRYKLKEVCNFYTGTGFPVEYQGKGSGELPFYKVGDISGNVAKGYVILRDCNNYISWQEAGTLKGTIVPPNTVVFAKIGEALKLNRRALTAVDCLIDNNTMGICPGQKLNTKFFFYFMLQLKMEKLAESTTVPSVRKSRLENVEIDIPTYNEQTEIVAVLDVVSNLISDRRKQLTALDTLIKARFVEMFGDPVSNSKRLPTLRGDEFFKLSNGKFIPESKRFDMGIPAYGGNGISWYTDDVLCKENTIVVGRVGFQSGNVHLAKAPLWVTDNAMYVGQYNKEEFDLVFLCFLMEHIDFTRYQDAGDLKKITQKPFMHMEYIHPPLSQQKEYTAFVAQVDKSKLVVQKALDEAQLLFDSLMQQYFG